MTLEENLAEKLKTVKDRVEWILANHPEARNDDFYLYLLYVRLFEPKLSGYIKFIPFNLVKSATRFETIRRCRQKLQEQGLYLPTDPKVLRKRRKLAEAYRRVMPQL